MDLHYFDADPDPTFHSDADLNPDPDHTFQSDLDPDPTTNIFQI